MSDIELVIKIPEDSYKATCDGCMLPTDVRNVVQGIKNGTPLPKGHGRLIDADAVKRRMGNLDGFGMIGKCIDEFPTIIEADTESEEVKC